MKRETQPPFLHHERLVRWALLGVVGLGAAIISIRTADWSMSDWPCGFREMSGLPCAMCGGTRAALALVAGNWKQALEWNALAVPFLALMAFATVVCGAELARGRALCDWRPLRKWSTRLLIPAAAFFLAWWIFHVRSALENPESGLADPENPVAAVVADWLGLRRGSDTTRRER